MVAFGILTVGRWVIRYTGYQKRIKNSALVKETATKCPAVLNENLNKLNISLRINKQKNKL